MVTVITRTPPPPRRTITNDIRSLKVGETLKTDEHTLASIKAIVSRIRAEFKDTAYEGRSFNVTSRDGFIYITRVS